MDILPFFKSIQSINRKQPIQTNVWTFDVAGRVVSLQLDYWHESEAPSQDYPLRFVPCIRTTAKLIDWASGVTYEPRAVGLQSSDHERHPQGDPGVY